VDHEHPLLTQRVTKSTASKQQSENGHPVAAIALFANGLIKSGIAMKVRDQFDIEFQTWR